MFSGFNSVKNVWLAACLCGVFSLSPAAYAQEADQFTEENIREFIEKTTVITSGHESEMSKEEIDAYLNAHIHDQARFKSTMRYSIPGFDVQEKTMIVDKEEFMKGINQATDAVSDYESQIEVSEIEISKDGRKATVQTRTMESGTMPVADEIEQKEVPIEGMSTCTQILTLNDEHITQMYNANCVTDISFQTFAP